MFNSIGYVERCIWQHFSVLLDVKLTKHFSVPHLETVCRSLAKPGVSEFCIDFMLSFNYYHVYLRTSTEKEEVIRAIEGFSGRDKIVWVRVDCV